MSAQKSPPGPRYQALLQLLRAAEAVWNASRVFFGQWELSPSQFNVLNLLRDWPAGVSQIELSRQLTSDFCAITATLSDFGIQRLADIT